MMPKYCSYFECKSLICDYFTIHNKHPFKSFDNKIIHHDTMKGKVSHRYAIQHYMHMNTAFCAMLCPAARFIWLVSSQHLTMASMNNTFCGFTQLLCHCKGNVEATATSFRVFLFTITHQAQNGCYKNCSISKVP